MTREEPQFRSAEEDRFLLVFNEECPPDTTKRDLPKLSSRRELTYLCLELCNCTFSAGPAHCPASPRLSLEVVPALCRAGGSMYMWVSPNRNTTHPRWANLWRGAHAEQLMLCLSLFQEGIREENMSAAWRLADPT